jgi:hypothetical protein
MDVYTFQPDRLFNLLTVLNCLFFIETASECDFLSRRNTHTNRSSSVVQQEGSPSDLQQRYDDALKQIERLETEREQMLETLCKQADTNNSLKDELEDLKCGSNNSTRPSSRTGSRPSSGISKSDSMASITSERCANCIDTGKSCLNIVGVLLNITLSRNHSF